MNTHDKYELPPLPGGLALQKVSMRGPVGIGEAMQAYARAAIEADRKQRGEPVAWRWLYNGKPDSETCYPLPLPGAVVRERASAAAFPRTVQVLYASPQPADPVKVPSDDEILAWAGEEQFFLFADPEEVLDIVKSALQHFGQPKPSNSGELEPAASAQPVVNQSLADALNDALDNLLHDNYERSYSGSKNREADAELIRAALVQQPSAQGREDAFCVWHNDPETDSTWETGCGNLFILNDGTPAENRMKFCCYCGKQIREAIDHAIRIEGEEK